MDACGSISSTTSARCAISTMASSSGGTAEESWTIDPDDPLSAHGSTRWTQTLSRDGWSVSTETLTEMTSDATSFHLRGRIVAREGSRLVFERDFDETIPRGFI